MSRVREKRRAEAEATTAAPPSAAATGPEVVARPLLKFAGGKAKQAPKILSLLPAKIRTYFEPMFGGGAVYFALCAEGRFRDAVLSDLNQEVIDVLRASRRHVDELIGLLGVYTNDIDEYQRIRGADPSTFALPVRAARTIYLNKCSFNGLFRVNSKGQFNVPFGHYTNPTICDTPNLRSVSAALNKTHTVLLVGDFEAAVSSARKGDAVYFDPPYLPRGRADNFTSYTAGRFGVEEHERLAACFRGLAKKGVAVVLSNADTVVARKLYKGFTIHGVKARRNINCNTDGRKPVTEILVTANTP
jgi:DNA adenine methylase